MPNFHLFLPPFPEFGAKRKKKLSWEQKRARGKKGWKGTHILTIQSWNISRREKDNWKHPSGSGKQAMEETQKKCYVVVRVRKENGKILGKALSLGLIFKKVFSLLFFLPSPLGKSCELWAPRAE